MGEEAGSLPLQELELPPPCLGVFDCGFFLLAPGFPKSLLRAVLGLLLHPDLWRNLAPVGEKVGQPGQPQAQVQPVVTAAMKEGGKEVKECQKVTDPVYQRALAWGSVGQADLALGH